MSEPNSKDAGREANATEDWREITEKMASLSEKYQYMLEHDILTDCTFVVGPEDGETREFKAHRLQVAHVSPVFEAMLLRGEMVEAKTGLVRVTDLSPHTFQLLLSTIYGKEAETTTFKEAHDLAFAADKYQMKTVLENCVTRMCALIKSENIWTSLKTADLLQNKRLREKCVQVLKCDTQRCITDAGFMQASEENVALLLEQDVLNVEDELVLVNTAVQWARHEARRRGLADDDSGVRAVLEPRLLSLFRLLAMSPQQFMLGPGLAGWLTSDEKTTISECLQSKDFCNFPQHLSSIAQKRGNVTVVASTVQIQGIYQPFICKREVVRSRTNVQQTKKQCCVRLSYPRNYYYHCVHATLIFKVNSNCKLLGFQCASRCGAEPSVNPTAFVDKSPVYHERIIATAENLSHTLSTDFKNIGVELTYYIKQTEYNSSISVMFIKPVPLVPDNWFALDVKFQLFDHFVNNVPTREYPNSSRASKVCTATGVEFEFHTEEEEGYYTSVNDGIIEALIFSL